MENNDRKPPINVDYFEDLTGEIANSGETPVESVGERLSVLRKEKGLSLSELSKLTGFEVEFLEDIEMNRVQPQVELFPNYKYIDQLKLFREVEANEHL